jgi:hypothetical protein
MAVEGKIERFHARIVPYVLTSPVRSQLTATILSGHKFMVAREMVGE